jgi:hypothetical protein
MVFLHFSFLQKKLLDLAFFITFEYNLWFKYEKRSY